MSKFQSMRISNERTIIHLGTPTPEGISAKHSVSKVGKNLKRLKADRVRDQSHRNIDQSMSREMKRRIKRINKLKNI